MHGSRHCDLIHLCATNSFLRRMSGETAHQIAFRKYLTWCLLFLFMLTAQPGSQRNKRSPKRQRTPFKWFEFEGSLDNDLF